MCGAMSGKGDTGFPSDIATREFSARYHIRHAQHQIGEPFGGIEHAGGLGAGRHGGKPARIGREAGDLVGERSGVKSSCLSTIAPPAFASTLALASWSWSSACGSGTRIAGRPIAASSATVEAPERETIRCDAAMRAGRSEKNGATSALTPSRA